MQQGKIRQIKTQMREKKQSYAHALRTKCQELSDLKLLNAAAKARLEKSPSKPQVLGTATPLTLSPLTKM